MDPNERKERQQHFDSRLQSQDETHPGWKDAWLTFCYTLLEHGGALAVPPPTPDPLLGMLQERGRVHDVSRVIHIVGSRARATGTSPRCGGRARPSPSARVTHCHRTSFGGSTRGRGTTRVA